MIERKLEVGTRVRLTAPSPLLTLTVDTGRVEAPAEWDGYYFVRLDGPAIYRHADGRTEEIAEIREDAETMEVLGD